MLWHCWTLKLLGQVKDASQKYYMLCDSIDQMPNTGKLLETEEWLSGCLRLGMRVRVEDGAVCQRVQGLYWEKDMF